MLKTSIVTLWLATGLCFSAFAQKDGFGVGIIVGEPTGVAFKHFLDNRSAVDAAAAYSFVDDAAFQFHVDYLIHHFGLIEITTGQFPVYWGIGGRIKLAHDARLGVQIPLGISYIFEDIPLDAFIEIRPLMDLLPETTFTVNGGIGVRYYLQ
ncbi:MAG: hypothetical protein JW861_08605 [Bacteroidales bacterium]|nr:hypothetical protein [Bacteroidales bacterium]